MVQRIVCKPYTYGEGLKSEQPLKQRRGPHRCRKARERDEGYLEQIRQCPCLKCGIDPCNEAAHVRMSAPGKPNPGVGSRPDDRFSLPLCHADHMQQHDVGERDFWHDLGIDPFPACDRLHALKYSTEAMRAYCWLLHASARAREE